MKVIDLILKYNKKEEMPKNILINGFNFKYDGALTYIHKDFDKDTYLFTDDYDWGGWLNDEVDIIQDNKIEKLKIEQDTPNSNYYIRNEYGTKCGLTKHSKIIADKLNEIIDYLKSKGDE